MTHSSAPNNLLLSTPNPANHHLLVTAAGPSFDPTPHHPLQPLFLALALAPLFLSPSFILSSTRKPLGRLGSGAAVLKEINPLEVRIRVLPPHWSSFPFSLSLSLSLLNLPKLGARSFSLLLLVFHLFPVSYFSHLFSHSVARFIPIALHYLSLSLSFFQTLIPKLIHIPFPN
ncbi:hypothetical protein RIF29_19549 [Crotalaria pallida]|uniref:Uncharacterized protein n=1 Tax=Crotalaria pallida TaxID=3830 RepID=A0AAN9I6L6_CROPI